MWGYVILTKRNRQEGKKLHGVSGTQAVRLKEWAEIRQRTFYFIGHGWSLKSQNRVVKVGKIFWSICKTPCLSDSFQIKIKMAILL